MSDDAGEVAAEAQAEAQPQAPPVDAAQAPAETTSAPEAAAEPISDTKPPTPSPTEPESKPQSTSQSQPQPESTLESHPIIITDAPPLQPVIDASALSPTSTAVLEAELAAATEFPSHHLIPSRLTPEEQAVLVASTPEQESAAEQQLGAIVPDEPDTETTTSPPTVDIVIHEPEPEPEASSPPSSSSSILPSLNPQLLAQISDGVIEPSQRVPGLPILSPRSPDHVPDVSAAVDAAQAAGVAFDPMATSRPSRPSVPDEEVSDDDDGSDSPEESHTIHHHSSSLPIPLPPLHGNVPSTSIDGIVISHFSVNGTSPPISRNATPDPADESDVADDGDGEPIVNIIVAPDTLSIPSTSQTQSTTPSGTPVMGPTSSSAANVPGLPATRTSDSNTQGLAVTPTSATTASHSRTNTPSKPTPTPLPIRGHSPSIFQSLLGHMKKTRDPSPQARGGSHSPDTSPDGSPRIPLCSNCVSKPYKNGYCTLHYKNMKKEAEQKTKELQAVQKREKQVEKDKQKAAEKAAKLEKKKLKEIKKGHSSAPAALGGKSATDGLSIQDALLIELREAWTKATKVVFKDVPRLAKRTTIQVHSDAIRGLVVDSGRPVEIIPVSTDSKSDDGPRTPTSTKSKEGEVSLLAPTNAPATSVKVGKDVTTWQAVTNVVLAVAKQLETQEKYDVTAQKFKKLGEGTDNSSDFQGLLEELFTSTLGTDSATFAVFRAVHQSILFPPIFHLKTKLYSQLGDTMKDVRRDDGWTVHIYIGEAVYVTHTRWEQSMNEEKSPEHFEVQWQVRLSFDRKLQDLRASFLRIQEISFHEQINAERKKQIQSVLRGGGYMV